MSKINDKMLSVTRLCCKYPRTIIILTIVLTIVSGYFGRTLESDNSMERMLPADEPIVHFYNEFREHFNLKNAIVLGIEYDKGVYTPEILAQVDRLSKKIGALDRVDEVQSLTTMEDITGEDGMIVVEPLADKVPVTAAEVEQFASRARNNAMFSEGLVSKDETATIIFALPSFFAFEPSECIGAYYEVKKIIDEDPGPGKIYFAGLPTVIAMNTTYMIRDNKVMLPIIALTVLILLWISFRSLRGVWIPISVVVAAVIWTFGALGALGMKINIISTSIPIVLVAMGIADGIHVLHEYYHCLRKGQDNHDAVVNTMREMNSPVVMTSFTTAVGFLALSTSQIVPIKEYGASVAFGILAAMVFSLTFIPASLILLGKPKNILSSDIAHKGVLDRFSKFIGRQSLRHAGLVLVLFFVALIIFGSTASFLKVRNNPVHYFRQSSEIRKSDDFFNAHFAGTGEVIAQIDAKTKNGVKNPELLTKIRQLQDRLETMPEVGMSLTINDFLERMNYVLNENDPAFNRVPGTKADLGEEFTADKGRSKIAQYLLLYEMAGGTQLEQIVDYTYRRANIRISVKSNSSVEYKKVIDELNLAYKELFDPDKYSMGITGHGQINLKVVQYLVLGQIVSLVVSLVVVFFMLVFLFRSVVDALVGTVPLIITVLSNFAVMVVSDIPLNMGTALIASVIIGVGVDYSIHFIHRYRLEQKRNKDIQATVETTMNTSGRAILFNAIAVGGGFAVLLFSSFLPVVYLGLLVPLVMIINALAALIVIPAFLNLLDKRKTPA